MDSHMSHSVHTHTNTHKIIIPSNDNISHTEPLEMLANVSTQTTHVHTLSDYIMFVISLAYSYMILVIIYDVTGASVKIVSTKMYGPQPKSIMSNRVE